MEPNAPRIALATEQDRPTVLALLSEHLPGTDVARRHAWLYEQNPHGRALTFVAYDRDGTPMGLTSLFPRRVVVDREVRVGSIGGDGYVRPAFRRRGVATALHRACLDAMNEGPIEFMYGAPVPNNLKALERAGTHIITNLRRYARPPVVHRTLRSFARLGPGPGAELAPIDGLDRRVAELWERASAAASVMPVRDPAHYAWRFGATPAGAQRAYVVTEGGRAVALCALEKRGREVALIDFLAPSERYAAALRATANAAGAGLMMTLVNEQGPTTGALWQAGFLPREGKGFQVLVPEHHAARTTLPDPTRWYYMWGDGDLDRILQAH
jgi:GNAT superfamily N-acetyltransferase